MLRHLSHLGLRVNWVKIKLVQSEMGHPLAPASRIVETPCVVPGRDAEVLGDLPQEVALTIALA